MKRYFVSSRPASAATALSATSGPTPVMSPNEMPIQPVMKVEGYWLRVERRTLTQNAFSEIPDEGFFLQSLNPLLFEPGLFLDAEGLFNIAAYFAERFDVGRADLF